MVREVWLEDTAVVGVGTFHLGGCEAGDTERMCECVSLTGSPSREGTGEGVVDITVLSGVLKASSISSLARVMDRCVP